MKSIFDKIKLPLSRETTMTDTPTAAMIVIGDEVLSGRTQDANTQVLATMLGEAGIDLCEGRAIRDERGEIIGAVNALRARYTYVFTSGGIGPTHDDITAEAVADAMQTPISIRDDARAILAARYGDGETLTDARLRMARIPDGAILIDNPVSGAPGFRLGNVFVLAGVPQVFAAMLDHVRRMIATGPVMHDVSIPCPYPEGVLGGPLTDVAAAHPSVSIGPYPRLKPTGGWGVTIVARSRDMQALERAEGAIHAMIEGLGGSSTDGE